MKLPPVRQRVDVSFSVAAVDFFDRLDAAVVLADRVPDQSFEPVEAVNHNRLVVVLLRVQFGECGLHIGKRSSQRELVAVDLPQPVFRLYEDGMRRTGGHRVLPIPSVP